MTMRISKNRIDMDDKILRKAVLEDYGETIVGGSTGTNTGSSYTLDLTNGNIFNLILTANCTFTFSNPPASGTHGQLTIFLQQDGTGSRTVTWPSAVIWPGGTAPTLTTTALQSDLFHFSTYDGGVTWFGNTSALNLVNPTVPDAPTSLSATAGDSGTVEIDLAWTAPADDGGSAITGYEIYRDTTATATTLLTTIGATTSYNDTSVSDGTTYYYRVKAVNAVGSSTYSNEDSDTPTETGVVLIDTHNGANTNNDTYTATGIDFGAVASGTRHLIAVFTFDDNDVTDSGMTFAVTIGGQSATVVNSNTGADSDPYSNTSGGVVIAIASENTATSGTVVLTISGFNGTMDSYDMALYRAVNLSSATPTTTPTGSADITLVVPSGGFGVVGAVDTQISLGNTGSFSGTGAETAYSGGTGAAMLRKSSGSVVHDATNATDFAGATWTFS